MTEPELSNRTAKFMKKYLKLIICRKIEALV